MKIEHIAFNVSDPIAVAEWYCRYCGLRVVRHVTGPAQTHFLADSGSTVLEVYCNPPDAVPDYRSMNPLVFHLAFASKDPVSDSQILMNAGAVIVDEVFPDQSSHLIMMRDPWGLPLQLCKRSKSLI
ncbi:MAG: VOC family protein [Gloeobacteraceae cyanobacterium ES-bin-144]|nr:VOC family protein [Verrucomicrobiales bacterium]